MLARLRQVFWIALFLCFSSGFGVVVWHASKQPHPAHDAYHSSQHNEGESTPDGKDQAPKTLWQIWAETRRDPTAFFTFWVAIFTLFLAVSTVGLWIVTGLTLRHARKTTEHQLRAYVFNGHANIVGFDEDPTAQVLVKNYGQTPAYGLVMWNAVQLAEFPLSNQTLLRPAPSDVANISLGPGADFHLASAFPRMTGIRRAAILNGTAALYVYGEARYRDAFGNERFTRWRLFYGGDVGRHPQFQLAVYPEGNEAN